MIAISIKTNYIEIKNVFKWLRRNVGRRGFYSLRDNDFIRTTEHPLTWDILHGAKSAPLENIYNIYFFNNEDALHFSLVFSQLLERI